ncbi:hypothetical protein KUCAC02_014082 [Chaenocephalus aceratus]|uniref:Uncharacterized protein n=1 Tax=Chaenocephalus aceratus TaxID=36190 RepID=A0ACB9WCQ5_CHAAC|nr:hypothetical protein KUCAC02_014082 [Chaenocephalus aceratus]
MEYSRVFPLRPGLLGHLLYDQNDLQGRERCYTGKGKAADTLDVKTLGCVKAEECDVENTVELFSNSTIFVMTKHCCNTPLCNSAHKLPHVTLLCLTVAVLTTWHLSEASTRAR